MQKGARVNVGQAPRKTRSMFPRRAISLNSASRLSCQAPLLYADGVACFEGIVSECLETVLSSVLALVVPAPNTSNITSRTRKGLTEFMNVMPALDQSTIEALRGYSGGRVQQCWSGNVGREAVPWLKVFVAESSAETERYHTSSTISNRSEQSRPVSGQCFHGSLAMLIPDFVFIACFMGGGGDRFLY